MQRLPRWQPTYVNDGEPHLGAFLQGFQNRVDGQAVGVCVDVVLEAQNSKLWRSVFLCDQ